MSFELLFITKLKLQDMRDDITSLKKDVGRRVYMHLELGKKIALLRKSQKRTQSELAEYLCVQPQTVSRWEAEGGTPDISLLPKIALFFGVTLDELFGMTDMEQINQLVYKYSVLRDEKTFEEVIRSIEMGVDSCEEEIKNNPDDATAKQKREQLLAWKVHVYIQKSRKAKEDAEQILDDLMAEVTWEEHPLHQALRLQKQQFRIQSGEGTAVVKEAKENWEKNQTVENLYTYMAALMEMDNGTGILQLWQEEQTQRLVGEVTDQTIPLWHVMFRGAVSLCNLELFEKNYALFEEALSGANDAQSALFEVKWEKAKLYKSLEMESEKERCKETLLQELEQLKLNEYLRDFYRKRISEM